MTDVVDEQLERLIKARASTDHETTADERSRLWRDSLERHRDALEDEHRALWCAPTTWPRRDAYGRTSKR